MKTRSGLLAITILFIVITPALAGNISPGVTNSVGGQNISPGSTNTATTSAAQSAPSGSSGSGGSSGSSLVMCESLSNIEYTGRQEKNLVAGQETTYNFRNGIIPRVGITGSNNEFDIPVRIDVLKGQTQCDGATDIGAYKYFNINVGTKRIQTASFNIALPIELGNEVKVMRWNKDTKEWQEITTVSQGADDTYSYYQVTTNRFSNFAIVIPINTPSPEATIQNEMVDEPPQIVSVVPTDESPKDTGIPFMYLLLMGIGGVIVVVLLVLYLAKMDK